MLFVKLEASNISIKEAMATNSPKLVNNYDLEKDDKKIEFNWLCRHMYGDFD